MKKALLTIIILFTASACNAQDILQLPPKFIGRQVFGYMDELIVISGYYYQNNKTFNCFIIKDLPLSKKKWRSSIDQSYSSDSLLTLYYNQLGEVKLDRISHNKFLFSRSLNYILTGNSNKIFLDSIVQASSINNIATSKDSLLYVSVVNNNRNFIARKKGYRGNWEIIPIIFNKPHTNSILIGLYFYSVCLIILFAILLYFQFRKEKKIQIEVVKSKEVYNHLRLAADKPLDYEQITNKDTKDAIDAIIEVIQNRNTLLPMTIAVNGSWGSGKSTIMNCIRQQLDLDKEKRFITTWFNAWHQQDESSLLNAFLLKIINRYEKPFYKNNSWKANLAFMRFRLKLASSRFIKWTFYNQILSGFALTFLILITGIIIINLYGYANNPIFKNAGLQHINLWDTFSDGNMKSVQTIGSVIVLILSVCSFFILKSETTPTIGAFLNVMYKKSFLVDAEKSNPDMREKFRIQYWEIMEAVEDRVLIVFIDDLDRVNGNKIFEMLEAINFIGDVTSRPDDSNKNSLKTVFVLGLFTDQIAEQLGYYIQKESPYKEDDFEKAKKEAKVLGRRYLEKMIQLNIPVPLTNKAH